MKRILLSTALSVALMSGITGCGDDNQKKQTIVKKQEPTRTLAERKKAFEANLKALNTYGLDANLTTNDDKEAHYLLHVSDPKKAMISLMEIANQHPASLDRSEQEAFMEVLKTQTFGLDVNWEKYQTNAADSVTVYYISKDAKPPLKKLIDEKKLAAYLSFDNQDALKKIRFNNLDERLSENNETVAIKLQDTHIDFSVPPSTKNNKSAYTLTSKAFNVDFIDNEFNTTTSVGYNDITCKIDKENAYLGKESCVIPTITITSDVGFTGKLTISDTHYDIDNTLHDKKIKSDVKLSIDTISGTIANQSNTNDTLKMKDLKIDVVTDNIDAQTMKTFYDVLHDNTKDANATIREMMHTLGEIYSNGTTIDYTISLASTKADTEEVGFLLTNYTGKGNGRFDDNISYHDMSTVKSIEIQDKETNATTFAMHHMQFGYAIKDLYNILPAFFDFSGKLTAAQKEGNALPDEKQLAPLKKSAEKIVHQGFGFDLDPIGFDDMKFDIRGKEAEFGKLSIALHTLLKRNDIPLDINNPMTGMMLIPFLQADGKIVIRKKDLELLAKQFPPAMVGMAMMMGKPEGENLVYDLKFENGHLLVNGQPMM